MVQGGSLKALWRVCYHCLLYCPGLESCDEGGLGLAYQALSCEGDTKLLSLEIRGNRDTVSPETRGSNPQRPGVGFKILSVVEMLDYVTP